MPSKKIRQDTRQKIEQRKRLQLQKKNETNPFELRYNKIKHNVLGRKVAKNELGKPFVNRNRAFQKRKETLLEEYKNQHKGGKGVRDFREDNAEDRVIHKYKQTQNEIKFDHKEVINLTHKGKPLEDFIDDRVSSDDEDIDLFGRENYVETTHFGGGADGPPRSATDVLNSFLEEKKQRKLEKEETIELTAQLDDKWNLVKNLIKHKGAHQGNTVDTHDEYDNLLSQLVFEGNNSEKEPQVPKKPTNEPEVSTSLDPDTLLKAKLKLIDSSNDLEKVIKTLKEVLDLLTKVSRKSLTFIKERLLVLSKSTLRFTLNELGILIVGSYYKELQVLIYLMITRSLHKLKLASYHEVAISIFLNNFLLKTIHHEQYYPELFIHLDNLVRLCLPSFKTELRLLHRLNYEADCILSVRHFAEIGGSDLDHFGVSLSTLFGKAFSNIDSHQEPTIAYNLAIQVFQLLHTFYGKYHSLHIMNMMISQVVENVRVLTKEIIPTQLRDLVEKFLSKCDTKPALMIVNDSRAKPFILPMLECKFEEDLTWKKSKGTESRRLTRKYKREMKGAQREIRKDATFLRDTYLKEVEKKDKIRKKKVKELLRDLSIQQGLYKKKQ